jgi:elongation factor Ts
MEIDRQKLKELRDRISCPFLDCRKALEQANNDIQEATKLLREWHKPRFGVMDGDRY